MKKKFLSLTLGSLLVSALSAEDNGFFVSAGYQIGESTQMVKNTKGIQDLSDSYERLNNLLTNYSVLNTLIRQSADPNAINNARGNLNASAKNLINDKKNSPAYQAVLLALNAAVGFWNSIAWNVQCGGYTEENGEKKVVNQIFYNQPGRESSEINCGGLTEFKAGVSGPLSVANFKTLNDAYQIIQTAFKDNPKEGLPVLSNTSTQIQVQVKTKTNGNDNTTTITASNDAQNLLKQASVMMDVLTTNCPWVNHNPNQLGGASWNINKSGNACEIFDTEISTIQNMIKNAQEFVAQVNIVKNNSDLDRIDIPSDKVFNPFTDASFAEGLLKNAKAQVAILTQTQQVVNDLNTISKGFMEEFLASCNKSNSDGSPYGTPLGTVTKDTWATGCAYVGETVTNLKNSIAHFGDQAEQIHNAQNLAYTLANFSAQYKKLGEHYDSITASLSSLPDAQSLQNVVSKKTNPNSPQGIQDNYYIDSNIHSQVQSRSQELGSNPFRRAGLIAASTTNNGAMNGIGFQVGYKQFFGKNKRWGARYYGFVDYNHTYNKSQFFNASSDVWTYGVGSDLLVNFINDKATKHNKISFGAFGGIALAGTSWLNSQYVNLANVNNYYKAKINTSNFQFLFNLGLRTNLARNKRIGADHSAQHGMELGVKIPTINTNYYSLLGTTLQYRRLYSVYLNYVFAY
ncbi:outer membrane protein HopD [Helicobacter pylori Hp H-4]|uniref:Hop family adhesin SabA n=1 Tax=Helicobacter pylori TaxID=210 RepID=UPI00026AE297|nr:SabA family sialic acid-binding adhesin [Helicobacter pylori]EJB81251.1 outer membrane protein HopD [Helicobacter pylori Hp H-4]